jgi:hypothetical protein
MFGSKVNFSSSIAEVIAANTAINSYSAEQTEALTRLLTSGRVSRSDVNEATELLKSVASVQSYHDFGLDRDTLTPEQRVLVRKLGAAVSELDGKLTERKNELDAPIEAVAGVATVAALGAAGVGTVAGAFALSPIAGGAVLGAGAVVSAVAYMLKDFRMGR